MRSNKKSILRKKVKKRTQRGGGVRFWKQLVLGRFFGVGGPSRSRHRSKRKSRPRSPSKSKSPPKNRLQTKPKVKSEVDILFDQYKNLTLDENKFKRLSKKDREKLVEKITHYKEKQDPNSDYNFN